MGACPQMLEPADPGQGQEHTVHTASAAHPLSTGPPAVREKGAVHVAERCTWETVTEESPIRWCKP